MVIGTTILDKCTSVGRSIKDLIAEARILPDKLDDAFDSMIDDDAFLDGWYAIRKIKGAINPKIKPKNVGRK